MAAPLKMVSSSKKLRQSAQSRSGLLLSAHIFVADLTTIIGLPAGIFREVAAPLLMGSPTSTLRRPREGRGLPRCMTVVRHVTRLLILLRFSPLKSTPSKSFISAL
jgi:hypothetical protein